MARPCVRLALGDQARELLHEIAAIRETGERVGEARHLEAAVRVFELAIALREFVGAIADLLFEFQAMRGGARDAALLRVPDGEQHEHREHRVAERRRGREPG